MNTGRTNLAADNGRLSAHDATLSDNAGAGVGIAHLADKPNLAAHDAIEQLGLPPLPQGLPRLVIDSHTHLDTTEEVSGLSVELNLALAAEVGVHKVVQVATDVAGARWSLAAAQTYDNLIVALALHPNDAANCVSLTELDAQIAIIDELSGAHSKVRGVGETGLDYYRTRTPEGIALQKHSFAAHIEIANRRNLTLVIHDRDAHDDILRVLDASGVPQRVVMHCFSGDADFARACLDRGAWLSFPGTTTYSNAENLREALAITPLDRLLVETDAPYLPAVPNRGKRNAPYLVPNLVRFIADYLGLEVGELCDQLTLNTEAAFAGGWGEHG